MTKSNKPKWVWSCQTIITEYGKDSKNGESFSFDTKGKSHSLDDIHKSIYLFFKLCEEQINKGIIINFPTKKEV